MNPSTDARCAQTTCAPFLRVRKKGVGRLCRVPLIVLVLSGCTPPDHPPIFSGDLPANAVNYLEPGQISTFNLEAGVVYRSVRSWSRAWSVHLVEVDVSRCELGFRVVRAESTEGRVEVTEMARRSEPGAVAAINGDFFTPEDLPIGLEVSDGKVRGSTARPVFAWRPGELPWVGPIEEWEDSLQVGDWALSETRPGPEIQILAGFPSLLERGARVGDLELGERPQFSGERHPRTAVGFDPERRRVWLVVVEGRREGVSEGMTLPELARLFRALGVRNAINLDGGGSSVMVIRGEAVSRPSDPAGERPVVNGLVLRQDEAYCVRGGPRRDGLPPSGR